ncbi:MAG: hypothetical protein ACUZ8H_03620 [Candidatus Anammoxibacter sp.]
MEIIEKGIYEFLQDWKTCNSCTIQTISKGEILTITRVDIDNHQVLGNILIDWTFWDLPVKKI